MDTKDKDHLTFVVLYVDDMMIFSNNVEREKEIKAELASSLKIKDLGEARFCLGIEITRQDGQISLCQSAYIHEILRRFNMSDCNPVKTPMAAGTKLTKNPGGAGNSSNFPYRELIGALTYAVSSLSQFNSNPSTEHWTAAKQVLRYLKGSVNIGLTYRKNDQLPQCLADSDWGNCIIDRRSYTCFTCILSNAAVSWESRKQRTIALSSTEAKYIVIAEATKEALYLLGFLKEIGFEELAKVMMYNDNQGAHSLVKNPVFHSKILLTPACLLL